jgi:hypothetical protein
VRYYAPWLGRWTSCDPAGLIEGPNLYAYVSAQPIRLIDEEGTNGESPDPGERDVVFQISQLDLKITDFWDKNGQHGEQNRKNWTHPLSELERGYIEAFGDKSTPEEIRMHPAVDPAHLTSQQRAEAERWFGKGAEAASQYANFENRRLIVSHFIQTHPTMVQYELGLYRLVRDINPIHFALERGWQIGAGKEMFTGQDVSRLHAAGEFLLSLATVYGVNKAAAAFRPTPGFGVPTGAKRALTDPIYDLPPEGGGMPINGRYYTEHALERMAPDTPQVQAELRLRIGRRLDRLGIKPSNPAYGRVMERALGKQIDPRGVPPSVVEAEILRPGSTNVTVITAKRGQVVVTVVPR